MEDLPSKQSANNWITKFFLYFKLFLSRDSSVHPYEKIFPALNISA